MYNEKTTNTVQDILRKFNLNIGIKVRNIKNMLINNKDTMEQSKKKMVNMRSRLLGVVVLIVYMQEVRKGVLVREPKNI